MSIISAISNPRDGTALAIQAGETLTVTFEIENDNPLEVVGFYFAVAGLPAEWWSGPQAAEPWQVVAGGRDILTLTLQPAAGAQPANYPFTVQIQAVNDQAGTPPACSLTLGVEPGAEPVPVPQAVVVPEVVMPEVVEPKVIEPAVVEPQVVEPVREQPPVVVAAPPPEPVPPPPPAPAPTPPPAPAPLPPTPVTPSPAPKPAKPAARVEAPVSRPIPQPAAPAPQPAASRQPAPPPAAPVETVSLQREPVAVEVQQKVASLPEADRQVINPEDRRILHMLPGERLLLRFKFHNTQNFASNYILDEDRMAALPDGWLERTQAQVNLTSNAEGEVFCLITPPAHARPGEYQFALFIGAQHAERPEERYYTLLVEATPAVTLTTKETKKQAGPFGYEATFPLTIANAGNSETAFRVAVRESRALSEDEEETQLPRDLYETPNWTYQFDHEVENLKAPAQGRDLKPVEVHLRIRRRGPWWWGFQEAHTATVAAVPVTDAINGGKEENLTQVTLRRWRLLPFPYIFLVPIILILLIAGSQAGNLRVTNGMQCKMVATYYVFGQTAHIKWNAVPLIPQTLTFENKTKIASFLHSVTKNVNLGNSYFMQSSCSVRNEHISIKYLGSVTDGKLQVIADGQVLPSSGTEETAIGDEKVSTTQVIYKIRVTRPNFPIRFNDTDPESQGSHINIFPVAQPDGFTIPELQKLYGDGLTPSSGGHLSTVFKITAQPGATGDLLFVTTDKANPIICLRLESQ